MKVLKCDVAPDAAAQAAEALRSGDVIIYPTDTLYGMGCDSMNPQAISRVYSIKKLNKRKHLTLLCCDIEQISKYAQLSNTAYALLKRLLPGPYTFILPATRLVPRIVIDSQRKVGIRVPDNEICLEIIRQLGRPVLNTSASYDDEDSEENDPEIIKDKYREANLLLDCGSLENAQSSVIDISADPPIVVREGKGDIDKVMCIIDKA